MLPECLHRGGSGCPAELQRFVDRACPLSVARTPRREGSWKSPSRFRRSFASGLPPLGSRRRTSSATLGEAGRAHPSIVRAHPLVATLADALLERTLDADGSHSDASVLGRTGAWPAASVSRRTILVLARLRHELTTIRGNRRRVAMVEEALPVALVAGSSEPLTESEASALLLSPATATLGAGPRRAQLEWLEQERDAIASALSVIASRRAEQLLEDHRRVRDAASARGRYEIRAVQPVDVIGAWVLLPATR